MRTAHCDDAGRHQTRLGAADEVGSEFVNNVIGLLARSFGDHPGDATGGNRTHTEMCALLQKIVERVAAVGQQVVVLGRIEDGASRE